MWIQFVNSCAFKMKNHRIFDQIIYKNQNGTHFDHHSFTINPNNIQTWNNQHTNGKLYIFVVRQLFCLQLNQLAWIDERKVRYCSKVHLAWNLFTMELSIRIDWIAAEIWWFSTQTIAVVFSILFPLFRFIFILTVRSVHLCGFLFCGWKYNPNFFLWQFLNDVMNLSSPCT